MAAEGPTFEWDDELSAFEYMMYRADGDQHSRTTMAAIETLDVVPDWQRFRGEIDRVSRLVPRLRQRVVAPIVPVTAARWVYDPDFDLDYHVRRVVLPGPADMRALLDLAQILHSTPLDPGRPLWEVTLVEGVDLDDAEAALVWKLSHAVTDGMGGLELDRLTRHRERDPDLGPMPPVPAPEDVSPLDMTRRAVRTLPIAVARSGVRRLADAVGDVRAALASPNATVESATRTVGALRRMSSASAAGSPLLARRGTGRRFEAISFPLCDLRTPAKAHGCSVNDAYIAAICGALRLYHEARGMPVDAVPLAMPVNIRPADGSGSGANQWSAATLPAPVGIVEPVERMQRVRELVLTARSDAGLNPASLIAPVVNWLPNSVIGSLQPRLGIDVQASNVPGFPFPRYLAGARIVRSIPIGPAPGVALMITMLSLDGVCHVGVNYDTDSITDADLFADCLARGFGEVFAAPAPSTTTARKRSADKRAADKRAAKKRAAKKRAAEKRAAEKRAAEKRAAEKRAAEKRAPGKASAQPAASAGSAP